MFEKTEGKLQNIAGRVQDALGATIDDPALQAEGKVRRLAGAAQAQYGEALDGVRRSAAENPLGTLAAVAGLGFLLGALWSKR